MMNWNRKIVISNKTISIETPVYFIADIAANHDGRLSRAKDLIWRAKEAGADCAKFQHFRAEKIVSDYGFKSLGRKRQSHQAGWKKSVFQIYRQYECDMAWTRELVKTAKNARI
ncbi:MAG TPA: N-acetylneuraminate synthase family protein, partial [Patescibacteria group bacterium]|nr:N-acetylneuraminate synthase family protein [Patescibacteria group bacterium]